MSVDFLVSLEGKVDESFRRVCARAWREYSPKSFLINLARTADEFSQMRDDVGLLLKRVRDEGRTDSVGFADEEKELGEIIAFLERSIKLEEGKKTCVEKNVEHFSFVEQKVLARLLKMRYFCERARMYFRRVGSPPVVVDSVGKNLLELLEAKEREIAELKEKSVKLKEFALGVGKEKGAEEMQKELVEFSLRVERENTLVKEHFREINKKLHEFSMLHAELQRRVLSSEEALHRFGEKTLETVAELKKQKNLAQEFALQGESETLKLRSMYTNGVLGMEKEKLFARQEVEKFFEREISFLRKELERKNALVDRLEKIVSEREKKIVSLGRKKK
jgi:hypothetical protein